MTKQKRKILISIICLVALFFSSIFVIANEYFVDNLKNTGCETKVTTDLPAGWTKTRVTNGVKSLGVTSVAGSNHFTWYYESNPSIEVGDKFKLGYHTYNEKDYQCINCGDIGWDTLCFAIADDEYYIDKIYIGNKSTIDEMTRYAVVTYTYSNGDYTSDKFTSTYPATTLSSSGFEIHTDTGDYEGEQYFSPEDIDPNYESGKIYFIVDCKKIPTTASVMIYNQSGTSSELVEMTAGENGAYSLDMSTVDLSAKTGFVKYKADVSNYGLYLNLSSNPTGYTKTTAGSVPNCTVTLKNSSDKIVCVFTVDMEGISNGSYAHITKIETNLSDDSYAKIKVMDFGSAFGPFEDWQCSINLTDERTSLPTAYNFDYKHSLNVADISLAGNETKSFVGWVLDTSELSSGCSAECDSSHTRVKITKTNGARVDLSYSKILSENHYSPTLFLVSSVTASIDGGFSGVTLYAKWAYNIDVTLSLTDDELDAKIGKMNDTSFEAREVTFENVSSASTGAFIFESDCFKSFAELQSGTGISPSCYGFGGDYFIYNYGKYITGYNCVASDVYNNSFNSELTTTPTLGDLYDVIENAGLDMGNLDGNVYLYPLFADATITVICDGTTLGTTTYNSTIALSGSTISQESLGKRFINAGATSSGAVVPITNIKWNFELPSSDYVSAGSYIYNVTLTPLYATQLYKVTLKDLDGGAFQAGDYTSDATLPTTAYITFEAPDTTTYVIGSGYLNGKTYGEAINSAFSTYETAVSNRTYAKMHKINTDNGDYYIYLTPSQLVEKDLPIFKQGSSVVNLWYTKNESDEYLAYKTDGFDDDGFVTDATGTYYTVENSAFDGITINFYTTSANGNPTFYTNWQYENSTNGLSLYANYHKATYNLSVNITLDGAQDNAGFAIVKIYKGNGTTNLHKTYLVYNNLFYSVNELPDDETSLTNGEATIALASGYSFQVEAFDQGDISSKVGNYTSFVGKKFASLAVTDNLTDGNADDDVYFVSSDTIEAKTYEAGTTVAITIDYTKIAYTVNIEIDDSNSGNLNVYQNGTLKSSNLTSGTLSNVKVGDIIWVEFVANVGFEYGANPMVFIALNNDQVICSAVDNKDQYYMLSVTGEFLSANYYAKANTDYSTEDANIGTLKTNTRAIEFTHKYKLYDSTVANNGGIVAEVGETTGHILIASNSYSFSVNELCSTSMYKNNKIITYSGTKYAILNSKLYYVNNETNASIKTYNFLMSETEGTGTRTLMSTILANMVQTSTGKIVSADNRTIYTLIEVRELVEFTLSVETDEHSTEFATPSMTMTNGNGNTSTVTRDANSVKILSYIGLNNNVTIAYDTKYYSGVDLILNDDVTPLASNVNSHTFAYTGNSNKTPTLKAKFTTKSLLAAAEYWTKSTEGVETLISGADIATYVQINTAITSDALYVGDSVGYNFECINEDYFMSVYINGVLQAGNSGSYLVTIDDYEFSKVLIKVLLVEKPKNAIQVSYALNNKYQAVSGDNFGTFDVIMTGDSVAVVADDAISCVVSIIENRKLSFDISGLKTGYKYVEVTHNGTAITVAKDGNVLTITDNFIESDAGEYKIMIEKCTYSAVLNLTTSNDTNRDTLYTMQTGSKNASVNAEKTQATLTSMFVGKTITFSATETDRFALDRFYYLNDTAKVTVLNNEFTITSALLDVLNVEEDETINFGFELKNKYLFTYSVTGTEYLESYEVSEKSGTYLVDGTTITFDMVEKNEGKNDFAVTVNDVTAEFDDIKAFEITQDTNIVITVSPKKFNASVINGVYNDLPSYEALTPEAFAGITNDGATQVKYGSTATVNIKLYSTGVEEELRYVILTGNDSLTYRLVVKDGTITLQRDYGGVYVDTNDVNCPYTFSLEGTQFKLTFEIKNTLTINAEYISNKVISQLNET